MELTKKDIRNIHEQAVKDAWRLDAKASEYAHLYKMTYLQTVQQEILIRMEAIDQLRKNTLSK